MSSGTTPTTVAPPLSFASLVWAAGSAVNSGLGVVRAVPVVNNVVESALATAGLPSTDAMMAYSATTTGASADPLHELNEAFRNNTHLGRAIAGRHDDAAAPATTAGPTNSTTNVTTTADPPGRALALQVPPPREVDEEGMLGDLYGEAVGAGTAAQKKAPASPDDSANTEGGGTDGTIGNNITPSQSAPPSGTLKASIAGPTEQTTTVASGGCADDDAIVVAPSHTDGPATHLIDLPNVAMGTVNTIVVSAVGTSADVLHRAVGINAAPIVSTLTPTAAAASALTVTALRTAIGTAMHVGETITAALPTNPLVGGVGNTAANPPAPALPTDARSAPAVVIPTATTAAPAPPLTSGEESAAPSTLDTATAFLSLAANPKAALADDRHLKTIATVAGTVAAAAAVNALSAAVRQRGGAAGVLGPLIGGVLGGRGEVSAASSQTSATPSSTLITTPSPAANNALNFSPNFSQASMADLVASMVNGAFTPSMLIGGGSAATGNSGLQPSNIQHNQRQGAPMPPIVTNPVDTLSTAAGTVAMGAISAIIASAVSQTVTAVGRSTRAQQQAAVSNNGTTTNDIIPTAASTQHSLASLLTYLPVTATNTALGAVATILPLVGGSGTRQQQQARITPPSAATTTAVANTTTPPPHPDGAIAVPSWGLWSSLLSATSLLPTNAGSSQGAANAACVPTTPPPATTSSSSTALTTSTTPTPLATPAMILLPMVTDAVATAMASVGRGAMTSALMYALHRVGGGRFAGGPFVCVITSVVEVGYNLVLFINGRGTFLDVTRALILAGGNVATLAAAALAGGAGGGPLAAGAVAQIGVVVTTMTLEMIANLVAARFGDSVVVNTTVTDGDVAAAAAAAAATNEASGVTVCDDDEANTSATAAAAQSAPSGTTADDGTISIIRVPSAETFENSSSPNGD